MSHEEDRGSLYALVCLSLIGVGLIIGGALWLVSLPEDECPCNAVQCCSMHEFCPVTAPCLCVTADNDLLSYTCGPVETTSAIKVSGAQTMVITGVIYAIGLEFLLLVVVVWLAYKISVSLGKSLMQVFALFGGTAGVVSEGVRVQSNVNEAVHQPLLSSDM